MSWDNDDMESSDEEEENLCLMGNHKDDEVTAHFFYQDLFHIYK